ncbi:MAG: Stp1/IreP family PP2C-type Ser/Thr phosphatase [bacterium]|nr:Stp1/IreP family PP2C-type Ser/Thr phosphatase [bacterium]
MAEFFEYGNYSDVGRVRTANEDYFASNKTEFGQLFIVCDGMGGHKGGYVASRLAVDTIIQYIKQASESDPKELLQNAIQFANRAVYEKSISDPELRGMGTTCVMVLIRNGKKPMAWRAHIGDSRLYLIRKGEIHQLTQDHSRVMEMVKHGIISEEDAAHHPERNIITRAIGVKPTAEPEVDVFELCKNDRLILCTDGISGPIAKKEILHHSRNVNPQMLAEDLVRLANERGGEDNATVQVVDILEGPKPSSTDPIKATRKSDTRELVTKKAFYKKPILWIPMGMALLILVVGLWFTRSYWMHSNNPKKNNPTNTIDSVGIKDKSSGVQQQEQKPTSETSEKQGSADSTAGTNLPGGTQAPAEKKGEPKTEKKQSHKTKSTTHKPVNGKQSSPAGGSSEKSKQDTANTKKE